jgi:hypothetical protein
MKPMILTLFVCLMGALLCAGCRQDSVSTSHFPKEERGAPGPSATVPRKTAPTDRVTDGLKTGDMASRKRTAEKICRMTKIDDSVLEELQGLLKAESAETRVVAAYALG